MSIPLPRPSRPTLLRRFTLLSLGTTIAVGLIFGAITARLGEDFALRRQARATGARVWAVAGSRRTPQDYPHATPARPPPGGARRALLGKADRVHDAPAAPAGAAT